jgi:predicted peroxiredoxin
MSENVKDLVLLISHGIDSEMSSVAFTLANGSLTAGFKVSVFLASAGVDLVRKKGIELTEVAPFESLQGLVQDFIARGGTIWVCPPCAKARGYEQSDLIDGVTISGASPMLELIKAGAETLSF